jgi:hypothetical protein
MVLTLEFKMRVPYLTCVTCTFSVLRMQDGLCHRQFTKCFHNGKKLFKNMTAFSKALYVRPFFSYT